MTRFAVQSDQHLEFRSSTLPFLRNPNALARIGWPETLDVDAIILAGDVHPVEASRKFFINVLEDRYQVPVLFVPGNHDFYGSTFPKGTIGEIWQIGKLRVAGTTLWTHLSPSDFMLANLMSDFRCISNTTFDSWNKLHEEQLIFLDESKADVIITHHGPSLRHIHPAYAGDPLNPFFTTDLDLSPIERCRLWVSGHTHKHFDFIHDNIRFVVNPLGYPNENGNVPVVIVDI